MIVRTKKEENFAILDKAMLADRRLSWKARGVLAYLMSKSDNWKVIVNHLTDQSDKDGRDAVMSALKEMEELGYLVRHQGRDRDGTMLPMEYWVYERPVSPQPGFPVAVEPLAANPHLRSNDTTVGMNIRSNDFSPSESTRTGEPEFRTLKTNSEPAEPEPPSFRAFPPKVPKDRILPLIPEPLASIEGFDEVWTRFEKSRKELRKPLTTEARKKIWANLSKRPQDAIAAVELSLENAWQGVSLKWLDNHRDNPRNREDQPGKIEHIPDEARARAYWEQHISPQYRGLAFPSGSWPSAWRGMVTSIKLELLEAEKNHWKPIQLTHL